MKLRNVGSDAVSLYRPAGDAGALTVEPGQVCDVPGELVTEDAPEDAIVVKLPDGDVRAFSTARWEVVQDKSVESVASPDVSADVTVAKAEV